MKQKQESQLHSFVDHSSIEWHASQCPVSSSKPSSWPRSQQITVLQTSHSACNSDVRANAPLSEEAILVLLSSDVEGVSVVSLLQKMRCLSDWRWLCLLHEQQKNSMYWCVLIPLWFMSVFTEREFVSLPISESDFWCAFFVNWERGVL